MVLRLVLWSLVPVDQCLASALRKSARFHDPNSQQLVADSRQSIANTVQPTLVSMSVTNNALGSAHTSASTPTSTDGGKGEESTAMQGVEISSEKTVADFGAPDEDHLHGVLGVDNGKLIWNPTPLMKPLKEWTTEESKKAHEEYCFNTVVSDSISLDRERFDSRNVSCKPKLYQVSNMKPASIIVVFFNEAFSPLVRSLHSILNYAPPGLIGEIVLVDDGSILSKRPWLGTQLENYVKRGLPKTRLSRLAERSGLMRARMHGAKLAKFENLIILDSHIECSPEWIEPLLARLTEDYKNVALPVIETIDAQDFTKSKGVNAVMAHSWHLDQKYLYGRQLSATEPNDSPAMAGGLFAITKRWFDELGQYDPELQEYGGEEMEISFKIWQCGGKLQSIPCSRIAHVFRSSKYWQGQVFRVGPHVVERNKLRVAAVWMDDAARFTKLAMADPVAEQSIGDVSVPMMVRDRLKCHDFNWYLANVYPELSVPNLQGAHSGSIRHILPTNETACFDTMQMKSKGAAIGIFPCHGEIRSASQAFLLTGDGKLRVDDLDFATCLAIGTAALRGSGTVTLSECTDSTPPWRFEMTKDGHRGALKQGDMCVGAEKKMTDKSLFSFTVSRCTDRSSEDPRVLWEWV
eukprot:GEMP01035783.1.p1 GENE.GEMP01035783.1~~GEMP01035783.1.p1  ORF type:complete len:635 (+),score=136.91 GEMP01035783.1:103-2007(+)